jgi:hypothetical protein
MPRVRGHRENATWSLAGLIKEASSRAKKIKFVVGDGIWPVQSLVSPDSIRTKFISRRGRNPTVSEEAVERWKSYEYARFHTFNSCPAFGYFVLFHLARRNYIQSIVTTNYDLRFDSLAERFDIWSVNPSLATGRYSWESYDSARTSKVRLWKIHGSLSHVTFLTCSSQDGAHIFRAPHFPINNSINSLRQRWGFIANHDYFGQVGRRYGITTLCGETQTPTVASHFLDWAYGNKREVFKNQIQAAVADLSAPSTLAIVLLGFTGFFNKSTNHPYNEELVPTILSLSKRNPVLYFIHESQYRRLLDRPPPKGSLFHYFRRLPRVFKVYRDAGDELASAIQLAGLGETTDLRQEWLWDWVNGDAFITREHFPQEA